MKIAIFWDMMPWIFFLIYTHSSEELFPRTAYPATLTKGPAVSNETLPICQPTQRRILEYLNFPEQFVANCTVY